MHNRILGNSQSRGVAECENCGAIIVVSVCPDGAIGRSGTEKDGKCGDTSFTLIEEPGGP